MSKSARRELLLSLQPQYQRATWVEKQKLLDGFVTATGYDRKYAISLLNRNVKASASTRQRKRRYGNDIREILLIIWKTAGNQLCSKRLVTILPVFIAKMERFGHLQFSDEQKEKLLSLSAATIDRLLRPERIKNGRGRSTTKPGYLIKKQIPIRTFADWSDAKPGFVEADCVAHCGDSVHGQFLNTLTVTDIATTWTETVALLRRSEADVLDGLNKVRELLPFPMQGLDTDNGGEFINHTLLKWCTENAITFTRSREYKKNDQAHVEEKNGSVVRRIIGYDRYEGAKSWQLLSALYRITRLYVNYFQPSLKLDRKIRNGARVYRHYEKAQTPFERVLSTPSISSETKERLQQEFHLLDPVMLLSEIERLQLEFWRSAVAYTEPGSKDEGGSPEPTAPPASPEEMPTSTTKIDHQMPRDLPKPRRKRTDPIVRAKQLSGCKKGRKTTLDQVWNEVCDELLQNPALTRMEIFHLLERRYPGRFRKTQINTIGEKLHRWRTEHHPDATWECAKSGRKSPIDEAWPEIQNELQRDPTLTVRGLMSMLCHRYPDKFRATQRSTLVGRVKAWRAAHLRELSSSGQM